MAFCLVACYELTLILCFSLFYIVIVRGKYISFSSSSSAFIAVC